VIVLLLIEIVAALWYSISYIPFARKIIGAFLRRQAICKPCFAVYDEAQAKINANKGGNTLLNAASGNSSGGKSNMFSSQTSKKGGFTFLRDDDEP
jgi:hypothetical protein